MNTQGYDPGNTHAGKIIEAFLKQKSAPSAEDWKQLVAKHPQYASDIADAAMLARSAVSLVEEDLTGPLDKAAYEATVSKVLNLVHSTPSPQLVAVEAKVSASRGPAVRKLAAEVGLEAAPVLLSSILAGSVVAPGQVLKHLTVKFETSVMALTEFFTLSFAETHVPAFKAPDGKPQVITSPTPWKEAVRSLKLPEKQTQELLKLDD